VKGWAPGREIYFAMQFSKPFVSSEIVSEEKRSESERAGSERDIAECLVHFKTTEGEVILVFSFAQTKAGI